MAQASAADSRDQPSSNSAIASIRREARASWVRAAAARKSASVRSKRVIATVIAIPLLSQERRITPYRVAPIHLRVSGPGDWYKTVLLGISKRGNPYVRRLLIHGARSAFMHLDRSRDRLG